MIQVRKAFPHSGKLTKLRPLAVLDLLDQIVDFVLASLFSRSISLVTNLPVVHELGDRRARDRRNFDEIQLGVTCELQRCLDLDDPKLIAARTDKSDLGRKNSIIDLWFGADALLQAVRRLLAGLEPMVRDNSGSEENQRRPSRPTARPAPRWRGRTLENFTDMGTVKTLHRPAAPAACRQPEPRHDKGVSHERQLFLKSWRRQQFMASARGTTNRVGAAAIPRSLGRTRSVRPEGGEASGGAPLLAVMQKPSNSARTPSIKSASVSATSPDSLRIRSPSRPSPTMLIVTVNVSTQIGPTVGQFQSQTQTSPVSVRITLSSRRSEWTNVSPQTLSAADMPSSRSRPAMSGSSPHAATWSNRAGGSGKIFATKPLHGRPAAPASMQSKAPGPQPGPGPLPPVSRGARVDDPKRRRRSRPASRYRLR